MRKMFLVAAMSIGLFLGRAGAEAVSGGNEAVAPVSTVSGQLLAANLIAPAVAEGFAFTVDDGRNAPAAESAGF
jgi:hypothetical protein